VRAGPDGKIDVKEFRRLNMEHVAVSESVRRSISIAADLLSRTRRPANLARSALSHLSTLSGSSITWNAKESIVASAYECDMMRAKRWRVFKLFPAIFDDARQRSFINF
jgi:hypothetical protein